MVSYYGSSKCGRGLYIGKQAPKCTPNRSHVMRGRVRVKMTSEQLALGPFFPVRTAPSLRVSQGSVDNARPGAPSVTDLFPPVCTSWWWMSKEGLGVLGNHLQILEIHTLFMLHFSFLFLSTKVRRLQQLKQLGAMEQTNPILIKSFAQIG